MSSGVGVLVAARDAARTLHTALAGVAAQSTPPDAVLVVDDGSSDGTGSVAERWRDLLPIRVERLDTSAGVGRARRHGMTLLEQPLIATLDADDVWLPDHVRAVTGVYEPGRLVFARDLLWSPGAWLRVHERMLPVDDQLHTLLQGNLSSASILVAHDDDERVGGYRESLRSGEDWDLYIRMVRSGVRLVLADEPTLLYRISGTSTSAGYSTAADDVTVLELALAECGSDVERGWIMHELRKRRARRSLAEALAAADSRRSREARRHARAALAHGDRKTRAIAAAMVAAPSAAARLRAGVSRRRWSSVA